MFSFVLGSKMHCFLCLTWLYFFFWQNRYTFCLFTKKSTPSVFPFIWFFSFSFYVTKRLYKNLFQILSFCFIQPKWIITAARNPTFALLDSRASTSLLNFGSFCTWRRPRCLIHSVLVTNTCQCTWLSTWNHWLSATVGSTDFGCYPQKTINELRYSWRHQCGHTAGACWRRNE